MSRQHPVPAAVAFLSVHGNAERFLAVHRADEHGRCTGCFGDHLISWPCTVARLSQQAIAKRTRTDKRLTASVAPLKVLGVHGWRRDQDDLPTERHLP